MATMQHKIFCFREFIKNEFIYRLDVTRAAGGGHIEHL